MSSGIDDDVQKLIDECPVLLDEEFREKHPGIVKVAGFLDSASSTYTQGGEYPPFKTLGITNIADYIELVRQGNKEAIRTYKNVRDALCLGESS